MKFVSFVIGSIGYALVINAGRVLERGKDVSFEFVAFGLAGAFFIALSDAIKRTVK